MTEAPLPAPPLPRRPGPIVFAHANGFPAGTYRLLFEAWAQAGYEVLGPEKFGHDPAYAVTNNWPHLRDELIHFIERETGEPVFLVGHSLGGFLSLLAAAKRPDLARGVVLLDSPIISGWRARALQIAKATGLGERWSPAKVSQRRRQHWPSAEAAFEHFASKPAFAAWEPAVLRDYIAAGTERHDDLDGPDGPVHALSFRRDVETEIYNTLPHHIASLLRLRPLACALGFIGGTRSVEVRRCGLNATRRLARGRMAWIEGSHLFPMERPQETAEAVLTQLRGFNAENAARGLSMLAAGGFGSPPDIFGPSG